MASSMSAAHFGEVLQRVVPPEAFSVWFRFGSICWSLVWFEVNLICELRET